MEIKFFLFPRLKLFNILNVMKTRSNKNTTLRVGNCDIRGQEFVKSLEKAP